MVFSQEVFPVPKVAMFPEKSLCSAHWIPRSGTYPRKDLDFLNFARHIFSSITSALYYLPFLYAQ